jgi:hypothetical protein
VRALLRYNPDAKHCNPYKDVPLLKGRLYLIEFWEEDGTKMGKGQEWCVYVRGKKFERTTVFREMEQIADYISEHRTYLERATDAPTVTAILAIAILAVLTILEIELWMHPDSKHVINPIFSNALTLVLGYYFGQATSILHRAPRRAG